MSNRFRKFTAASASQLETEEGLLVVAPFLPSPLIERLGGEGFKSKVQRGTGADWLVYFWCESD